LSIKGTPDFIIFIKIKLNFYLNKLINPLQEKMAQKEYENELKDVSAQLETLRKKRIELLAKIGEKEMTEDYTFANADGTTTKFSELFGDRKYLFVVHNMGGSCPACTMWGDAFNGTY